MIAVTSTERQEPAHTVYILLPQPTPMPRGGYFSLKNAGSQVEPIDVGVLT
jgi:hypothetical protein